MALNKKTILLLTDWYEPGYKGGGPIQSCRNFVMAMQSDYNIFILTSAYDFGESKPYHGIISDTWLLQKENVQIYYTDKKPLNSNLFKQSIIYCKPDYIYLNSMYSYRFTILPLWLKALNRLNVNIIIAPRGMLQSGALQFKSLKKKVFLKLLNITSIAKKITFHATDEQERNDILKYFPKATGINVIPNFPSKELVQPKKIHKETGCLKCIFISRIAPKKNLFFFLELLRQLPLTVRLSLTVRGEIEDDFYWQQCLSIINNLPSNISISFKGPIPNNQVIEALQQHHIFVLPTLGENFGHAIFEAFLAGRPVLISDKSPWTGLQKLKIGFDLSLDANVFQNALLYYADMKQEEYDEWSSNAFSFAMNYSNNTDTFKKYKLLFS